jgi:hypothetical protein
MSTYVLLRYKLKADDSNPDVLYVSKVLRKVLNFRSKKVREDAKEVATKYGSSSIEIDNVIRDDNMLGIQNVIIGKDVIAGKDDIKVSYTIKVCDKPNDNIVCI